MLSKSAVSHPCHVFLWCIKSLFHVLEVFFSVLKLISLLELSLGGVIFFSLSFLMLCIFHCYTSLTCLPHVMFCVMYVWSEGKMAPPLRAIGRQPYEISPCGTNKGISNQIKYQNEFIMKLKLSENDSEPSGVLLS